VPNLAILCPATAPELALMLNWALDRNAPAIIRYPKAQTRFAAHCPPLENGRGIYRQDANQPASPSADICIAFTGGLRAQADDAAFILAERGIPCALYNLRFIKPVDEAYLIEQINRFKAFIIAEEGTARGSFAEYAASLALRHGSQTKIVPLTAPDTFLSQATRAELLETAGLSAKQIAETAARIYNAL
jgi:1-deoxy-D-xylulose-5-phosphate synthase